MTQKPDFDLQVAHRYFSSECFNRAWTLIDKPSRSHEENNEMLSLAMASLWHWRQRSDCTLKNLSIGYWQVSRVFALIKQGESARHYGELCLIASRGEGIEPFYLGYAYEALARAEMVLGRVEEARIFKREAEKIAQKVVDDGDRQRLLNDLATILY